VVIDTGPTETRQNKPLFRVDDGVRPKNNLTEPALLEMSGYATNPELTATRHAPHSGDPGRHEPNRELAMLIS